MKRLAWWVLPLLSVVLIFLRRAGGNFLLQDSDTAFLLLKIGERRNPWSWFWTDWPLENHFYRPVSTLAFELDRALYGVNGTGYGLTQALIAMVGVLLATWMLIEISESVPMGCVAGGLFGMWVGGVSLAELGRNLSWIIAVGCLLGVVRDRKNLWSALLAALSSAFFLSTLAPPFEIYSRIVAWLPGRTASVMALFCFAGVAAFARYSRSADRAPLVPTSQDVPATRGSTEGGAVKATAWSGLASLACVILALASYEQAVMMPAILTGVAILFWLRGSRPRWWVPVCSWVLLAGYFVVRRAVVPSGVSRYQGQQLRFGPGVIGSLLDFSVPGMGQIPTIWNLFDGFPLTYLTPQPWVAWSLLLGNLALILFAWKSRQRWTFLAAWSMALFSFLPMAWLKMFEHYYYWPSAFFALAVVVGGQVVAQAFVRAWSPAELTTPPRETPAPGSLA